MEDFKIKSLEYMTYLVARGYCAKLVKTEFDKVSSILRHEAGKTIEKSFENKVIFIYIYICIYIYILKRHYKEI